MNPKLRRKEYVPVAVATSFSGSVARVLGRTAVMTNPVPPAARI